MLDAAEEEIKLFYEMYIKKHDKNRDELKEYLDKNVLEDAILVEQVEQLIFHALLKALSLQKRQLYR